MRIDLEVQRTVEIVLCFDGASWSSSSYAGGASIAWAGYQGPEGVAYVPLAARFVHTPAAHNHFSEMAAAATALTLMSDLLEARGTWRLGRERFCGGCGMGSTLLYKCSCTAAVCQTCWQSHARCFARDPNPLAAVRRHMWRRACRTSGGTELLPVPEIGVQADPVFQTDVQHKTRRAPRSPSPVRLQVWPRDLVQP